MARKRKRSGKKCKCGGLKVYSRKCCKGGRRRRRRHSSGLGRIRRRRSRR